MCKVMLALMTNLLRRFPNSYPYGATNIRANALFNASGSSISAYFGGTIGYYATAADKAKGFEGMSYGSSWHPQSL